jgi:hypothetical protein
LCGGLLADFFSTRQLDLIFTWTDPVTSVQLPALSIIGFDFLFGIAFILGIVTLGTLARVREEGEVGREVILESLFFPTRELSRPLSSVPAYNLAANFPFGFLKRVPIPGIDVAVGVTAYQIAEMGRAATRAAVRGKRLTRGLVKALDNSLASIWKDKESARTHGVEITRQAARGALHAADGTPLAVENLVVPVTKGVVKVAGQAGVNSLNGILGTSQGIIQGAFEAGVDLGLITKRMLEAARKTATQSGLSEKEAVAKATEGILEAAAALGADTLARVKEALPVEALPEESKGPEGDV